MNIEERLSKEQLELQRIIDKTLAYAQKCGVSQAAASVLKQTGLTIKVRNQDVEKVAFSKDRSLSITVYNNHCKGSSATTDLSDDAIISTVDAAIAISHHTEKDEYSGLAEEKDLQDKIIDLDQFHPIEPDPDIMTADAIRLEKLATSNDKVKQSIGATIVNEYGQNILGNTYGQRLYTPYSIFSESVGLIAEKDGKMENGYGYHYAANSNDLWSLEDVAKEAIDDTLSKLGPRKLSTMTCPVIFDKNLSPRLFGYLIAGLSGRDQFKKTSFINDCLGSQLFPEWLSIEENPYIPKELASSCFDADGARTLRRFIINKGINESYILSAYSARQLKMQNTGNAGGTHNLIVTNSKISRSKLLKQMNNGLIVTELMGNGFDSITGDLSVGASGFWVENGEIQYPVNEITIAGNVKNMFKDIVAISNDINQRSSTKVGSVLIDHMKIAGN